MTRALHAALAIVTVGSLLISSDFAADAAPDRSPDLAAANALLLFNRDATAAVKLARAAHNQAPEREDLAWLALMLCEKTADCSPGADEQRFEQAFPANGAVWLNSLNRSVAKSNESQVDEALTKLSQANVIRFHWNSLLGHLAQALQGVRDDALPQLLDSVNASLLVIFPDINPVIRACKGPALTREGRKGLCQRAGIPLMATDADLGDVMGILIEKNSWGTESAQRALVEARITWNRCRGIGQKELFERATATNADAEKYLDLLISIPAELDVEEAIRLQNRTVATIADVCGPRPAIPVG